MSERYSSEAEALADALPPPRELSTSAQLRQTPAALAASQADLTKAECDRERLRSLYVAGNRHRDGLRDEIARLRDELVTRAVELEAAWHAAKLAGEEGDRLGRELVRARENGHRQGDVIAQLQQQVIDQGLQIARLQSG